MQWTLETRKIKDLKDYEKNPRRLTKDQEVHLKKSIDRFGLIDKPIITRDGTLIGGHQRKNILKKLGLKEVECWVPDKDLDEKEIQELNIRLNKNSGEFNFDVLANEFDVPDLLEWGFDLKDLVGVEEIESETQEEDEIPEAPKEPKSKLGDIYELISGTLTHRVICGDSTLPETVELCTKNLNPVLMVTDPPYGVEYDPTFRDKKGRTKTSKTGKVLNDDEMDWTLTWFLSPAPVAYVYHAGKFSSTVQKNLEDAEYEIISQIIWVKNNFALSRGDYHWKHEPCWYAVKKGFEHNWQGKRDQSTVWEIQGVTSKNQDVNSIHGTQKPLECMEIPIKNNSKKEDYVYDPFLGSGTTLIAAQRLGRGFCGIELSERYVDVIVDRWCNFMKKNGLDYKVKLNGEVI